MATNFYGMPGVYTGRTYSPRNIFVSGGSETGLYVPSFHAIDGSLSSDAANTPVSLLRAGLIMGKITTGGKYRPSIIGLTTAALATTDTSLTVDATTATEIARLQGTNSSISLKLIGPPTSGGTVATDDLVVSAASGTTLTITATGTAFASGSIIAPADGSQTPVTILSDQGGIDVMDMLLNRIDQPLARFLVGGDLLSAQIINLTGGDASTQAWIKTQLKAAGRFTFDNDR